MTDAEHHLTFHITLQTDKTHTHYLSLPAAYHEVLLNSWHVPFLYCVLQAVLLKWKKWNVMFINLLQGNCWNFTSITSSLVDAPVIYKIIFFIFHVYKLKKLNEGTRRSLYLFSYPSLLLIGLQRQWHGYDNY